MYLSVNVGTPWNPRYYYSVCFRSSLLPRCFPPHRTDCFSVPDEGSSRQPNWGVDRCCIAEVEEARFRLGPLALSCHMKKATKNWHNFAQLTIGISLRPEPAHEFHEHNGTLMDSQLVTKTPTPPSPVRPAAGPHRVSPFAYAPAPLLPPPLLQPPFLLREIDERSPTRRTWPPVRPRSRSSRCDPASRAPSRTGRTSRSARCGSASNSGGR